jgi:soluble lytic murein transglycosylase-like protein
MRYSKQRLKSILLVIVMLLSWSVAQANLLVIGSKDIKLKHLTENQLAAIYLGKRVSLPSGEILNPIDQNPSSKIYAQFYKTMANMDPSSVNSYWSGQVFSGMASQPPAVEGDISAIASVENSHKAIAYINSKALGAQVENVKVLWGRIPESEQYQAPPVNLSPRPQQSMTPSMRQKLEHEIAVLKAQQRQYESQHSSAQSISEQSDWQAQLKSVSGYESKGLIPVNAPGARKDLWATMARHFMLQDQIALHQKDVDRELKWFVSNKWAVKTILQNSVPYIAYVFQQTQQRGMPAEFALLPAIESGYVPEAHSHAGAEGLWQFMAPTARGKGMRIDWWYDGRRDFVTSTQAALNYLVNLHKKFKSWPLAAAAYNAGSGTIHNAIKSNQAMHKATNFWNLNLPHETENYVPKLLALSMIIANPQKYGFTLPALTTKPNVATITLHSQVDVAQAAKLAGVPREEIKELNPGMLRWATYPNHPYHLVIPADKLQTFKVNLARLSDEQRLSLGLS